MLRIVCLGCLVWFAAGSTTVAAEGLAERLDTALDTHRTARRTTVTLKVVDLDSGEVLYDRGGDRLQVPASNLKIYTSACALDQFGPEHRFTTTLRTQGTVRDGVLAGNLVLVGGGDAMLAHGDLVALADRVVEQLGIREIQGEVVVNNGRYGSPLKGPGWMWDDDPDYYNMSVTPLMVDFNVLELKLAPGAAGPTAELVWPSDYPAIERVPAQQLGGVAATRRPFTHPLLVASDAAATKPETLRLTMQNPGRWVRGMFAALLAERGVKFSPAGAAPRQAGGQPLTHAGPTLAETLKHFNHVSENAVGEVLLHEIALAQGTPRPQWSDGAAAITRWLVDRGGVEAGSFRLVDGSGLSRYNLISADSAVRLLATMHRHPHAATFRAALPTYQVAVAGKEQPLVAAKSGGMGSVSTISGYLTTPGGRNLAFSLLANGYLGSAEPVFNLRRVVWETLAAE